MRIEPGTDTLRGGQADIGDLRELLDRGLAELFERPKALRQPGGATFAHVPNAHGDE